MAEDPRLAYLQARLQARHGERPSGDDWRLAESSADLSHYLEAVRRTALKRWLGDVNHEMPAEAIERHLRAAWREGVDAVAAWSPADWRAAVEWLRWLPELPAVAHLLNGERVPPWMRDDPVTREFAFEEDARLRDALSEQALAPLLAADPAADPAANTANTATAASEAAPSRTSARRSKTPATASPVARAWIDEWRRRLPKAGYCRSATAEERRRLAAMLAEVQEHVEAMRASEEADGRALRNALAARLLRHFRHGAGSAVALFAHLALDGLELERLRAGVVARRLLPERAEGRSWA